MATNAASLIADILAAYPGSLVRKRGLRDIAFERPDGVMVRALTIHDLHLDDGTEVDENFEDDGVGGYVSQVQKTRHRIRVDADSGRQWYPRRDHPNEYVTFGRLQYRNASNNWVNVPLGTATRSGQTITWDQTNFSLSLTNTWHKVKLQAQLKTTVARRPIRWAVSLTGLRWDNWTLVSQSDSAIVGTVDKPIAWDENGSHDEPNVTLTWNYAGGYVTFGGDLSAAVGVVTIDPTFTDGYGGDTFTAYDTWVRSAGADENHGSDSTNDYSYIDLTTNRNILSKFTLTSLVGTTISSAVYTYYSPPLGSANYGATEVHRILSANSAWTEAGATWNYAVASTTRWAGDTGNNGGADAGCSVSGTDYASTALGTVTHGTKSFSTYEAVAITLDSTEFGSMVSANYGFALFRVGGTNNSGWFSSDFTDSTSARPKLVVTYTAGGGGGATLVTRKSLLGVGL
jgi:hypothetical protein